MDERERTLVVRRRFHMSLCLAQGVIDAVADLCAHPEKPEYVFDLNGEQIKVTVEAGQIEYDMLVTATGDKDSETKSCANLPLTVQGRLKAAFPTTGKIQVSYLENAFRFEINTKIS